MLIEPTFLMAVDRRLELLFHTSADNAGNTHRWQATVTHAARSGVGLNFDPFDLTVRPALVGLLQVADDQAIDKATARDRQNPAALLFPRPPYRHCPVGRGRGAS
jgi:hypothetical protein